MFFALDQILNKYLTGSVPMMSSDSGEDFISLDALDKDDLREIALNPKAKYSQLLTELLVNENQSAGTRSDDDTEDTSEPKSNVADPTSRYKTLGGSVANPTNPSITQDSDQGETSSHVLLGKRISSSDKEASSSKKRKEDPEASSSSSQLFDPIVAGTEEDKYHFKPPEVVKDYLTTWRSTFCVILWPVTLMMLQIRDQLYIMSVGILS